jgi:hypothetical protein
MAEGTNMDALNTCDLEQSLARFSNEANGTGFVCTFPLGMRSGHTDRSRTTFRRMS